VWLASPSFAARDVESASGACIAVRIGWKIIIEIYVVCCGCSLGVCGQPTNDHDDDDGMLDTS